MYVAHLSDPLDIAQMANPSLGAGTATIFYLFFLHALQHIFATYEKKPTKVT